MNYNFLLIVCGFFCAFSVVAKDTDIINYKIHTAIPHAKIHILTVDPKQVTIVAVRAKDAGAGLMTVDNIARQFNALAAINGGFFRVDESLVPNGLPAGILKINNNWHGIAYKARGALGWQPETDQALIDIVQTDSKIVLQGGNYPINTMNKLAQNNKAALLSDSYTTPIDIMHSLNAIILNQKVEAVYTSGNITVPTGGYIYNVSGDLISKIKDIKPGDTASVAINLMPQQKSLTLQWNKFPYVLGGGPVLIRGGNKVLDFNIEHMDPEFIKNRHPRTAIGILPDKRWVFVVAELSLLEDYIGISIPDLRDFMFELGCVAALNLDGGSSSAMYVEDLKYGSIIDQPVADAVIILPKTTAKLKAQSP